MRQTTRDETLEGWVVDLASLRTFPHDELLRLAQAHDKDEMLEGEHVESGYGLVDDSGHVLLLDDEATVDVAAAIRDSPRTRGVRLRIQRQHRDGVMETEAVEEISPRPTGRTDD